MATAHPVDDDDATDKVRAAHGCDDCIASHAANARRHGMTEEMLGELLAVVGMAAETSRPAQAHRVPVDEAVQAPPEPPA